MGEKPNQCSECDKLFLVRCSVIANQRLLTREKPHECSDCDKAFLHMQRHTGTNYINVASVTWPLYRNVKLKYISGYRLGRNHSNSLIVTRFSHRI